MSIIRLYTNIDIVINNSVKKQIY